MNSLEPYLQNSFQMHPDESEAPDHSHKVANIISASGKKGKLFFASYDTISLRGFCNFNRMTHTKSNDEIEPLIRLYRDVRKNANAGPLKRVEGDGGKDRLLWPKIFPELKQSIESFQREKNKGMPVASLKRDSYIVINKRDALENWIRALGAEFKKLNNTPDKVVVYGLDTECNVDDTIHVTRVLAIAYPGEKVAVLDLTKLEIFGEDDVPYLLKQMFRHKQLRPVAVNMPYDLHRLEGLGIHIEKSIDLIQMGKKIYPDHPKGYGMAALAERHANLFVDKSNQLSDWTMLSESEELQHYAALDPHLHLLLYNSMKREVDSKEKRADISVGKKVSLLWHGKDCAVGTLIFVGGESGGEIRRWGNMTIGTKKSLVKIERVLMSSVSPVYSFKPSIEQARNEGMASYDHSKMTLMEVFNIQPTNCTVAWPTERIRLQLEVGQTTLDGVVGDDVKTRSIASDAKPAAVIDMGEVKETLNDNPSDDDKKSTSSSSTRVDDESDDDSSSSSSSDDEDSSILPLHLQNATNTVRDGERNLPRSRQKFDRFHAFDAFPSSRDGTIKNLFTMIRRLVIQALIEFDSDDWDDMLRFLASKKDIHGLDEILDHFYFNREFWYRHVRNYPPEARKALKNIRLIREYIESNPIFKPALGAKLTKYFDFLEDLCESGQFEECYDVEMFQWDGTDSNGLNCWLRRRGSNRSENLHRQMRVAFGPHGVGAEVGHYLLLLLTYRYNVKTGIRRTDQYDFGMPYLYLIDRIQIRMVQLFDVDIFPKHKNLSLFKPLEGFVAVGIGELNYDERYVEKGEPSKNLKGDLLFVAKRTKLVGPPLHITNPREMQIFNDFMKECGSPKSKSWIELAKIFKKEADYIRVFPKLPSMLKNYYKKWQLSQELVAFKNNIHESYYGLLKQFAQPDAANTGEGEESSASARNKAAEYQKKQSDATKPQDDGNNLQPSDTEIIAKNNNNLHGLDSQKVAPSSAPTQKEYVRSSLSDGRRSDNRVCSGAPFGCSRLAQHCCGGPRKGAEYCILVKEGKITLPAVEEDRKKMRADYHRKKKRLAERRRKEKLKQQQSK